MKDLISIIVPTYNVENYLEKCVKSLIKQTYVNIEILLIDDGSTDNSGNLADSLALKDNRIRVYHKKNGGLSDARNYGIEKSRGKYVCFIDSDDYISLDLIETLYKELKQENADIAMSNRIHFYDSGKEIINFKGTEKMIFNNMQAVEEMNLFNYFDMSSCGKIFKKDMFDKIKFPVGKLCEDYYIMYKIILSSNKIVYIPYTYYYYYQRNGSISKNKKLNWDYLEASKEQMEYIKKNHPQLVECVQCSYAFANMTIYNIVIKCKGKIKKEDLKILRKNVKENLKAIISYRKTSIQKIIQSFLFVYFIFGYNILYKIYANNKR